MDIPIETNLDQVCPLCSCALATYAGTQLHLNDGITLWCPNPLCPAEEVSGHGKDRETAYRVILAKYHPAESVRHHKSR